MRSQPLKRAGVVGMCLAPVALHVGYMRGAPPLVMAGLLALQALGLLSFVLARAGAARAGLAAFALAALIALAAWRLGAQGLTLSSGIPYALAQGTLLTVFAQSLRAGREPLITGVMRRIRGPLPDELLRYGRRLTILWCGFFAANLAISAVLLAAAPLGVWSFFVNVVNLPATFSLFALEYIYRRIRFRHLPKSRLKDMIKAIVAWRAPGGGAAGGITQSMG